MYKTILTAIAFAGAANAATPPNFQPSSRSDLIVAFGNTLATEGVDLPKTIAQSQPTVGTAEKLSGSYSLIMVDPDIPRVPAQELLHWMQLGLVSAETRTNIGGKQGFALVPSANSVAAAPYIAPNPPALALRTHRYIQLLVNTTNNEAALTSLRTAGSGQRTPFNAADVISKAGLTVLAASWFNVTNNTAAAAASPTPSRGAGGTGRPSGTGATPTRTGVPFQGDAMIFGPSVAMLGLGVVMAILL